MKIILCFLIFLICTNGVEAQKEVSVTGTVISAKNRTPLSGVTFTVKGTSVSTISAEDGTFSLVVPKKHVIVISHVGYVKKELNVDSVNSSVTIALSENALTMNDVIVSTGYQQIEKTNTTGSYEKINNELFNRSTGTSILSRLDGITGSVLFDTKWNFRRIRKTKNISYRYKY